jgi:hypothetical protein
MATSLADYETQLTNVKSAIAKAENAQSYSIGSRSKTSALLKTLYDRQDQLEARIDQLDGGGIPVQAITAL